MHAVILRYLLWQLHYIILYVAFLSLHHQVVQYVYAQFVEQQQVVFLLLFFFFFCGVRMNFHGYITVKINHYIVRRSKDSQQGKVVHTRVRCILTYNSKPLHPIACYPPRVRIG